MEKLAKGKNSIVMTDEKLRKLYSSSPCSECIILSNCNTRHKERVRWGRAMDSNKVVQHCEPRKQKGGDRA